MHRQSDRLPLLHVCCRVAMCVYIELFRDTWPACSVCYTETQLLGMYRQSETRAGKHRRHTRTRNASLPTQANDTARGARKQSPNQGATHAAREDTTHTSRDTACHQCTCSVCVGIQDAKWQLHPQQRYGAIQLSPGPSSESRCSFGPRV